MLEYQGRVSLKKYKKFGKANIDNLGARFTIVNEKVRYRGISFARLAQSWRQDMATRLGEKLRKLRKENGFTLDQLAEKSGMSKSYLWELENRESQRPSAEKLTALSDVFGVGSSYFIEDDVREPKQRHLDEGFFREYQNLDDEAKEQLRKILKTFKRNA